MAKKLRDYFNRGTMSLTIAMCLAVAFYMALSHFSVVSAALDKVMGVISPFVYAFVLAFILNRPMMFIENKLLRNIKKKRLLSIVSVYLLFFRLMYFMITSIIPQLGRSISYLADIIPGFLMSAGEKINALISNFNWTDELIGQVNGLWDKMISAVTRALPQILTGAFSIASGVINLVMVLIITVYLLADKEKLLFGVKNACYAFLSRGGAESLVHVANRANEIFSGFIIGKLIDSTIIGVLCFLGMLLICPQYSTLISVVVGVTNMIPFFGPFIGAIPGVLILLTVDLKTAIIFIVFIIVLQQLDGNFIGPRILGNSLGLSPLWVMAGILVGNGLFGLVGMVIGVPTFALIYNLAAEFIQKRLREKNIKADYENKQLDFGPSEQDDADKEKI